MNVVAVGAHPDDIEVTALGTLLRCRERGDEVTIVTATDGSAGAPADASQDPADMASTRAKEAQAVADKMGATYVSLGYPDQFLEDCPEARTRLSEVFRSAGAELVITLSPDDYHSDHCVASALAHNACIIAANAGIRTATPALTRVPSLYYAAPVAGSGEGGPASHYVDISGVFDQKMELIAQHESQMHHMRQWIGWDIQDLARIVDAYRGIQSGVQYAEAFTQSPSWRKLSVGTPLPGHDDVRKL